MASGVGHIALASGHLHPEKLLAFYLAAEWMAGHCLATHSLDPVARQFTSKQLSEIL